MYLEPYLNLRAINLKYIFKAGYKWQQGWNFIKLKSLSLRVMYSEIINQFFMGAREILTRFSSEQISFVLLQFVSNNNT